MKMLSTSAFCLASLTTVYLVAHSVASVTTSATINVFAGTGSYGNTGYDGPATSAKFAEAFGVWGDSVGNVFFSDLVRVRRVDSSGIIHALFGTGRSSGIDGEISYPYDGDDGAATSASGAAYYLCGNTAGTIYIADYYHASYRSVDSSGILRAFTKYEPGNFNLADGISSTAARLRTAYACQVDTTGSVYLTDYTNAKIRKVDGSTQLISTVAGTGTAPTSDITANNGNYGAATSAKLYYPGGLYLDSVVNLYIATKSGTSIRRVDQSGGGIIYPYAGTGSTGVTGDGGQATAAKMTSSLQIAGDVSGNLYAAQGDRNNVRWIDGSTGIINMFAGSSSGTSGKTGNGGAPTSALLNMPSSVFVTTSGTLYLPEYDSFYVRCVSCPVYGASTASTTTVPSAAPSMSPTLSVTITPSCTPTTEPTVEPSAIPSSAPLSQSLAPSIVPSVSLSKLPSLVPSLSLTAPPSVGVTADPTAPTIAPSLTPSCLPSIRPSAFPSAPTFKPSAKPSVKPSRIGLTLAPTFPPSCLPSAVPTQGSVVISFNSSLSLHNVSASVLDGSSVSAVVGAVGSSVGVNSGNMTLVSQSSGGSGSGGVRRRLTGGGIAVYVIDVVVNVRASSDAYSNDTVNRGAEYLYELLTGKLYAAVMSSELNRQVREYSVVFNASATRYVGVVNVTDVSEYSVVSHESVLVSTDDDDDGDGGSSEKHGGLSAGEIAGVVIGGVVLLLLLILVFLYCCRKSHRVVVSDSHPAKGMGV